MKSTIQGTKKRINEVEEWLSEQEENTAEINAVE